MKFRVTEGRTLVRDGDWPESMSDRVAIQLSIRKIKTARRWYNTHTGTVVLGGPITCALCHKYFVYCSETCGKCPIQTAVKASKCGRTPYHLYETAERHGTLTPEKAKKILDKEIEFLEGLQTPRKVSHGL
jgi:hypothetical protein